jgi:hypothetical protein
MESVYTEWDNSSSHVLESEKLQVSTGSCFVRSMMPNTIQQSNQIGLFQSSSL